MSDVDALNPLFISQIANRPPVFDSPGVAATPENVDPSVPVYTAHATDADANSNLAYSIVGGDDMAVFKIERSTGDVSFINAPDFEAPQDKDRNNVYAITVRVSDGVANVDQQVLITVKDVVEATTTSNGKIYSGTAGDDTISADAGNSTILGGAGNDELNGGGGANSLDGGAGNDTLMGGGGSNTLIGGLGDDFLSCVYSSAANSLDGGGGNDSLYGGSGNDTLIGGDGDDQLQALAGNDWADGGAGNDTMFGGGGRDTLIGGLGNDFITCDNEQAAVSLDGGAGDDSLYGGRSNDTLVGGAGNDLLQGGTGNDSLDGGAGNDTVMGGEGANTLNGGDGNDFVSASYSSNANIIDAGAGDDSLYGGSGSDSLVGGDGDDFLSGGDGNDTLIGGAGFDRLFGGDGDDIYVITSRDVEFSDNGGVDKAIVSADFVKIPSNIESVEYVNNARPLPYWIDCLLPDGAGIFRSLIGQGKTFYYCFPTSPPAYMNPPPAPNTEYTPFNAMQKQFAIAALTYAASVTGLKFVATNDAAQPNTIAFAYNAQAYSSGYSTYPSGDANGSDIFINIYSSGNTWPSDGDRSAMVFIHELGHALGLKHSFAVPQNDGTLANLPALPAAEDTSLWTVMSYNSDPAQFHLAYSPLDIAALQYLYGPSPTARAGNDTYSLNAAAPNFIWDGAGVDTLSANGLSQAVTLYLEPGYWGFIGAKSDRITAPGQVTVNFGTVIENLVGGSGNDSLFGNSIANAISGGAGDDTITGGAGDDSIDGGAGLDTAVFAAAFSQARITRNANGSVTISSALDGADTLVNVEYAKFSDQTRSLFDLLVMSGAVASTPENAPVSNVAYKASAISADTHALLSYSLLGVDAGAFNINSSTGEVTFKAVPNFEAPADADKHNDYQITVHMSDGTHAIDQSVVITVTDVAEPLARGKDVDANGKTDIILQNAVYGSCYAWLVNGVAKLDGNGYVGWTPGADWQAKATGDFNGDGLNDILLQNAKDSSCYVWELNGLKGLSGSGFVGWTPGLDWQVKATDDFNDDGRSDVLLQNVKTGSCYLWELDGVGQMKGYGYVGWGPGSDWQVKGTGDFNGDGESDILLQNIKTGSCYLWELDGAGQLRGHGYVGWGIGPDWQVRATADFNNDHKTDILLQNVGDGSCFVWELDGVSPLKGYGFVGWTPGPDWQVKGTGDFNGDHNADILLQNVRDGSCYLWDLNGARGLVSSGFVGWTPGADWHAVS